MKNNASQNPFQFDATAAQPTGTRKLDYTPSLIALADNRAAELMMTVGKKPELHALANTAIDSGETQALFDLINAVFDSETIQTDSQVLKGCPDEQLSRLLESRRSDRSKTKAKGLRSNVQVCRNWISCGYAEILIRGYWAKPYDGPAHELDQTDLDAVTRKIKSLQSKKSRLRSLAEYDAEAAETLKEVEAEIDRLNALRPGTRVQTVTKIKDISVDQLREVLKSINPAELPAEEQVKLQELMAKLG